MIKNRPIVLTIMTVVLFMTVSCEKIKSTLDTKEDRSQINDAESSFEGCFASGDLSPEDALMSLRILAQGDPETIKYYKEYETSGSRPLNVDRETLYQMDVCSTVKILAKEKNKEVFNASEKNKEAYDLILQIIEKKNKYHRAQACAIRAIMVYGRFSSGRWHGDKRSIPVLKKLINNEYTDIRLYTAGTLLSLGEADIALPVLEGFVKEAGPEQSISALSLLFSPEQKALKGSIRTVLSDTRLFDERGKDILVSALNNSNDEVKSFAALRLEGMGIETRLVEDTALKILERLKNRKRRDYKELQALESDRRAGYQAINLLGELKSTAGIDVLKRYIDNTEDPALKKRAELVLNALQANKK